MSIRKDFEFSSVGWLTAIIKFGNTTPKNLNNLQFIVCFSFFSLGVYGEGLIMFRTLHISARCAALFLPLHYVAF